MSYSSFWKMNIPKINITYLFIYLFWKIMHCSAAVTALLFHFFFFFLFPVSQNVRYISSGGVIYSGRLNKIKKKIVRARLTWDGESNFGVAIEWEESGAWPPHSCPAIVKDAHPIPYFMQGKFMFSIPIFIRRRAKIVVKYNNS